MKRMNWLIGFFIVSAFIMIGCGGGGSSEYEDIPTSIPSVPTNISATAGDRENTISWDASSDALTYNIYWSTQPGVTKENGTKVAWGSTTYVHYELTNGTTYYYVVTASNNIGESDESEEVSATPSSTQGTEWNIQTLDKGHYPDIAVDSKGNPHISYMDNSDGYVKYAFKNETGWVIENVAYVANIEGGTHDFSGLNSLALDSNDNPHISYYSEEGLDPVNAGEGEPASFRYSRKIGGEWITTVIPMPEYEPDFLTIPTFTSSIVVDKNTNIAHVSLYLGHKYGTALGYWNPTMDFAAIIDYSAEVIDGVIGDHNAIVLDSYGYPHISYERNGKLAHAEWDGTVFHIGVLMEIPRIYYESRLTSIAIDQEDNVHIAYYDDGFKYTYRNGPRGTTWTVKSLGFDSGYPSLSLALDSDDRLHYVFSGIDYGNYMRLQHAVLDGEDWSFDAIDDDVNNCSIDIDSLGNIHVIYDSTESDPSIKHAFK